MDGCNLFLPHSQETIPDEFAPVPRIQLADEKLSCTEHKWMVKPLYLGGFIESRVKVYGVYGTSLKKWKGCSRLLRFLGFGDKFFPLAKGKAWKS